MAVLLWHAFRVSGGETPPLLAQAFFAPIKAMSPCVSKKNSSREGSAPAAPGSLRCRVALLSLRSGRSAPTHGHAPAPLAFLTCFLHRLN